MWVGEGAEEEVENLSFTHPPQFYMRTSVNTPVAEASTPR